MKNRYLKRLIEQFPMLYLRRGGKHWQLRRRDNDRLVASVSNTPSDWREIRNTISDIRRNLNVEMERNG